MQLNDIDWISRAAAVKPTVRSFIDGQWQPGSSDRVVEKNSPRDGQLLSRSAGAGVREVEAAVAAARRAFEDGRWSGKSVQERKDVLVKLASLMETHRDELALLECLDVGKPIYDAWHFDVPTAVACLRFNAEALDKHYGRVYGADRRNLSYELRRPVGVVAGIIGWNFPLYLATQKIGPVLAAGNCLVLKPSELTAFSATRLAELAVEAGVPPGVFNVVYGEGSVGAALAHHQDVDLLTFTGSTHTGRQLMVAAGQSNMKRLILECGGKSPNMVFEDCPDLEAVADAVVNSAFWNQGQVCVASSRLLIQEGVKAELLAKVIRKAAALSPGDPLRPETRFGALVSREHQKKVLDYIESGEREGAKLAHQSSAQVPVEGGFYVPPTIFDHVSPNQRIAQEEIFGPVLSVLSFREEQDAIRIANSTIYGLSATLWTRDLGRAHRISQSIDAGWITVNATGQTSRGPGESVISVGGHKQSGVGTEGGIEGLEQYLTKSAVQLFV